MHLGCSTMGDSALNPKYTHCILMHLILVHTTCLVSDSMTQECCMYTALVSLFLALLSLHFNENVFTLGFVACKYNALFMCASLTPFCWREACSWSCEMHVNNNKEMAFNYTEVLVYHSFIRPRGLLQRFCW